MGGAALLDNALCVNASCLWISYSPLRIGSGARSSWHPGKFPKVPGRRRGTRGFPAAPLRKTSSFTPDSPLTHPAGTPSLTSHPTPRTQSKEFPPSPQRLQVGRDEHSRSPFGAGCAFEWQPHG